jgi:hypothetical protein
MMKERLKRFCNKYSMSMDVLRERIDDLQWGLYTVMRLDQLDASAKLFADLLRAVHVDYPGAVQVWSEYLEGSFVWSMASADMLSPRCIYRIRPGWKVPDETVSRTRKDGE